MTTVCSAQSLAAIAGPSRRANSSRLEARASEQPEDDLPTLLRTLISFKNQSRRPTESAYHAVLRCAGDYALRRGMVLRDEATDDHDVSSLEGVAWHLAQGAIRDAEQANIDLGTEGLEQLLKLSAIYPQILSSVLVELSATSTSPTLSMYNAICRTAITSNNLEQFVLIIHEMFERDLLPTADLLKHAIRMACEWGCPRLALQMAERVEDRSPDGQRVDTATWIQVLIASAENQFLDGVETAWDRAVHSKTYTPDEGLILSVLNVAARWGRPDLATKALDLLPDLAIRPQEFHLVPLLEAYVNAGQVPAAIQVISSIRAAGMTPTMVTAEPIISALRHVDTIDQAFYALEDMLKLGDPVDIVALNAVILASERLGDLKRVRATQTAAKDLGLSATIDTFNIVLSCCVTTKHRALGDTILSEMAALSIPPDHTTYERMIMLSLTQVVYEDAFYYLEKMKAEGFKPPAYIYSALIRKCVELEDKRWRLVKEEMELLGYRVDGDLQRYINDPRRPSTGRQDGKISRTDDSHLRNRPREPERQDSEQREEMLET